jgi:tetratricopeptide (TPR) repeat protein
MRMTILIYALAVLAASAGLRGQSVPETEATKKLLAEGKFAEAVKKIEPVAKVSRDYIETQYILAQAYRLNGQWDEAEKTTQWMLDLRPEFTGGLWEAALIREHIKDLSGAVDLLNMVYHRTASTNYSVRIAVLEDLARIFDKQENKKDAESIRKEVARLKGMQRETGTSTHQ